MTSTEPTPSGAPAARPLPLQGIRVLDVSQVMAGPFCCMMLGDMGADVIKVEPPEAGDQTRKAMGFRLKGEDSPGFYALNRNKRSVAINLKTEAGRAVFYKLVETADILVENNRPGVTGRLKIDYDTLAKINPRLIYASITGFGQSGPWSQRPGFDLIAQAMSGVLSATGPQDGDPVKCAVPVADLGAGLLALYGILSAYIGRAHTGLGQHVDASLFETALGLSIWEVTEFWGTGRVPKPIGTANRMSAPYQAVHAQDAMFVVGAANQKLWSSLCAVIGRPELVDDARFANNVMRLKNRPELIGEIERVFRTRPAAHWVEALLEAGVPAGPVNDFAQALSADHTLARGMVMEFDHPVEGKVKSLGFPVKLSATPQQVRHAPPLLGQHTGEVLRELGLPADFVAQSEKSGAFAA